LLLTSAAAKASDAPFLKNVDRRIPKEPAYIATPPLYGLLVFGPSAQKRIWMVLDHSNRGAERYDILYVDLNANGDLTEPSERLVGRRKVFVGQPGAGASTFWAFLEHFLPESEGVQATLIYRDALNKECRVVCLLKERC